MYRYRIKVNFNTIFVYYENFCNSKLSFIFSFSFSKILISIFSVLYISISHNSQYSNLINHYCRNKITIVEIPIKNFMGYSVLEKFLLDWSAIMSPVSEMFLKWNQDHKHWPSKFCVVVHLVQTHLFLNNHVKKKKKN